jgi:hypothetical protein
MDNFSKNFKNIISQKNVQEHLLLHPIPESSPWDLAYYDFIVIFNFHGVISPGLVLSDLNAN